MTETETSVVVPSWSCLNAVAGARLRSLRNALDAPTCPPNVLLGCSIRAWGARVCAFAGLLRLQPSQTLRAGATPVTGDSVGWVDLRAGDGAYRVVGAERLLCGGQ